MRHTDPMVVRYASGALKNMQATWRPRPALSCVLLPPCPSSYLLSFLCPALSLLPPLAPLPPCPRPPLAAAPSPAQVTLKDAAPPPISVEAEAAIRQRSLQAQLEAIAYRVAARKITRAVQRIPPELRLRRLLAHTDAGAAAEQEAAVERWHTEAKVRVRVRFSVRVRVRVAMT